MKHWYLYSHEDNPEFSIIDHKKISLLTAPEDKASNFFDVDFRISLCEYNGLLTLSYTFNVIDRDTGKVIKTREETIALICAHKLKHS